MTEICWSGDEGVDCPQPDAGGIEKSGIPFKRFLDNQTWLEDYLQLEDLLLEIQLQMVDYQRLCTISGFLEFVAFSLPKKHQFYIRTKQSWERPSTKVTSVDSWYLNTQAENHKME